MMSHSLSKCPLLLPVKALDPRFTALGFAFANKYSEQVINKVIDTIAYKIAYHIYTIEKEEKKNVKFHSRSSPI